MKIIISIVCAVFCLVPALSSAQEYGSSSKFYLSAFFDRQSLGVIGSSQQLQPLVVSGVGGYWLRPGIGLELEAGFGLVGDDVASLELETNNTVALNLRLESPPIERFGAYALIGYVRTSFSADDGTRDSTLSFPGGRAALGLTYSLTQKMMLDAAFTHHDYDSDTRINSFRFGVRFDIGSKRATWLN